MIALSVPVYFNRFFGTRRPPTTRIRFGYTRKWHDDTKQQQQEQEQQQQQFIDRLTDAPFFGRSVVVVCFRLGSQHRTHSNGWRDEPSSFAGFLLSLLPVAMPSAARAMQHGQSFVCCVARSENCHVGGCERGNMRFFLSEKRVKEKRRCEKTKEKWNI